MFKNKETIYVLSLLSFLVDFACQPSPTATNKKIIYASAAAGATETNSNLTGDANNPYANSFQTQQGTNDIEQRRSNGVDTNSYANTVNTHNVYEANVGVNTSTNLLVNNNPYEGSGSSSGTGTNSNMITSSTDTSIASSSGIVGSSGTGSSSGTIPPPPPPPPPPPLLLDPQFTYSCFGEVNGFMNCCEMDRHTGDTTCSSTISSGDSWRKYAKKPFLASSKKSTFQLSCFADMSNLNCCQFDLQAGTSKCAVTTSTGKAWNAYSSAPFTAFPQSAGAKFTYSYSCFGESNGYKNCCQLNTNTGETKCSSTNSPTNAWVAYKNQPFNKSTNTSNYQLSCFETGTNPNCCQFDLNKGSSRCVKANNPQGNWFGYVSKNFSTTPNSFYEYVCFGKGVTSNCCQLDRQTGQSSCISTPSGSSPWAAFNAQPFAAGPYSTYDISCFQNGSNSNLNCCLFDLVSKSSQCNVSTSKTPGNGWSPFKNSPF